MRRFNSEALDRKDLIHAMKSGEPVRLAIARDQCMLCKSDRVNSVGLCEGCFANLTDEELAAATPWVEGRRI